MLQLRLLNHIYRIRRFTSFFEEKLVDLTFSGSFTDKFYTKTIKYTGQGQEVLLKSKLGVEFEIFEHGKLFFQVASKICFRQKT